jgi:hypothetical protein
MHLRDSSTKSLVKFGMNETFDTSNFEYLDVWGDITTNQAVNSQANHEDTKQREARAKGLFDDFQMKLAQVRRIQRRRRVEHEVACVGRLGERNDLANVGLIGKEHD